MREREQFVTELGRQFRLVRSTRHAQQPERRMADSGGNCLDRFNEVLDEGREVAVPFVEREPDALHGSRRQPLTEQRRLSAPGWTGDQRQRLPEPLVQPREQAWAQDDIAAKLRPQVLCESDSRRLLPEHSTPPCRPLGFWRKRR